MAGLKADVIDSCRKPLQKAPCFCCTLLYGSLRVVVAQPSVGCQWFAYCGGSIVFIYCKPVKLDEAVFVAFVLYCRLPTGLWTPSMLACDTAYIFNLYRCYT